MLKKGVLYIQLLEERQCVIYKLRIDYALLRINYAIRIINYVIY